MKELIIPFLIFVVFGSKSGGFQLIISTVLIVFILINGILSWLRFTYRLEENELRLEYGVFVRKKRDIPFERIQSLDLSEGILQRPFGLVKVKVETAGTSLGNGAEAVLTAISKEEAVLIQQTMLSAKEPKNVDSVQVEDKKIEIRKEERIYQISMRELLLLATTSGGIGVVFSAVIAFVSQFEDIIPFEKIFRGFENFIANGVVFMTFLVFIGFLLAWAIALFGTMMKYAHFTVKKTEKDLIITNGLLERRQLTIPLHRIQAIQISENLIRQLLGYSTVYIESAGGSAQDSNSSRVMILPIIKRKKIEEILSPYLVDYSFTPSISPAPKRALKRYMIRGLLVAAPFVAIPIALFRPLGYVAIVFAFIALFFSYLKYKDAGWSIDQQQLTLRFRSMSKNTIFMKRNRIQSLRMRKSFFQSKKDLASIGAIVMSGSGGTGGTVVDLEEKDVKDIYEWYSYTKHS